MKKSKAIKLALVILLPILFLVVGFVSGVTYNDLRNKTEGVILSSGPELEEIQQVTDQFVEAYMRGDAEGCANTYSPGAIFMAPDNPSVHGRRAIKERYESDFKNRNDSTTINLIERVYDVVYFEDWAVMRGCGYETNGETGSIDTYKWVILSKRKPDGKWETVWDIHNEVE